MLALLTTSAPDEAARNRALALFGAVSSGGMSLGLLLGGAVTDLGSWRWTLFINIPIGLAVLALTRRVLDETPRRPGRFDVVGALTATLGAVSIVWALIGAPEQGWASARTVGGLALGAAAPGRAGRHRDPGLAPDDPAARCCAAAAGSAAWPSSRWSWAARCRCSSSPCSTSRASSASARSTTGLAFLPLTLGIFAMSRVTPRLLARLGRTPMFVVGTIGLAASFAWLSQVSARRHLPQRRLRPDAAQRALAPAWCSCPPPRPSWPASPPSTPAPPPGLLQTFQQLGGAVGLAVIVSVYAAGAVPGQFLPGADHAFLTSAIFALTALAVAVLGATRVRRAPAAGRRSDADSQVAEVADAA